MDRAKELFLKYNGNRFYMDREGDGAEYDRYCVTKEMEEMWTDECICGFLESKPQGKAAVRDYSSVTELLERDVQDDRWNRCLYYPLRAEHLDDATVLYMLQASYRMAERAVKKHRFSKEECSIYIDELDEYIRAVRHRAENGTVTRSEDYTMQEFSDPVYIEGYLEDLVHKWNQLLH